MSPPTPSKNTRRSASSSSRNPRDTPAMRQHARFKQEHPGCVLFFRMGDFYEMFDEDARLTHQVLGLTLTERTSGIPMAGVPYHAAEGYIRRLIEQGHRVAVCEQVQDPSEAKGVVDRAVTRILTPGTLVDDTLLDDSVANIVVTLVIEGEDVLIAWAELSTGMLRACSCSRDAALDELVRIGPSEIIHPDSLDESHPLLVQVAGALGATITPRPDWTFAAREAADGLRRQYQVATLEGWGLDDAGSGVTRAIGGLVQFLLDTQAADGSALAHLQPPVWVRDESIMTIDAATMRSLEIERTVRGGDTDGSLLSVMQRCRTPMGRRTLRQWLCYPLQDIDAITARQDAVATLLGDEPLTMDLLETLEPIQDVARIIGRAAMRRLTPRDAVALGRSVSTLPRLLELLEGHEHLSLVHPTLEVVADSLIPLSRRIRERCVESPPAHLREGGLFADGIDEELDECRGLQRDGTTWLATYQQQLSEETGIPSLKIGFNKVFGYYIEVTHVHVDRVPASFVRKQTLKNAERYITPDLKDYEDRVLTAESRAIAREKQLFDELVADINQEGQALTRFAEAIADLDVLLCFADLARRHRLVRPVMTSDQSLEITGGRHPVLDVGLGSGFVPNDCELNQPGDRHQSLLLITGPNMAGKSTYIRQVALIVLLAHVGCSVPADAATIGIVDRIFARIGASDELHAGRSTFMVEMTETAVILNQATDRSLVILDEVGRGTSTLDGLSLAWGITEALASRGTRTLFATHYHELTDLADRNEAIGNRHVAVREFNDDIVFLHQIRPGRTDRSYGIHVGRLAGIPETVLTRAREVLDSLEVHHDAGDIPPARGRTTQSPQMNLFTEYLEHPLLARLREAPLESMTPLEAFDLLRTLRTEASED
ncbi:MAG: DNA mismatch repair protein MutS [Phycisphaerales bacterium]|nr:DNA mismatch repair protein MutS [Phycisphaerales bacterium]